MKRFGVVWPVAMVIFALGAASWRHHGSDDGSERVSACFDAAEKQFGNEDQQKAVLTFSKCDEVVRDAAASEKARSIGYQWRAYALDSLGRLDEAVSDLTNAIQLEPNRSRLYSERAKLLMKQGSSNLAMWNFDKSIELDGKDHANYEDRANAHIALHNFIPALNDIDVAIEKSSTTLSRWLPGMFPNPWLQFLYRERALVDIDLGDIESARWDLKKADEWEEKSSGGPATAFLRQCDWGEDRNQYYDSALHRINARIERSFDQASWYRLRSEVMCRQGNSVQAKADWDRYHELIAAPQPASAKGPSDHT